MYLICSYSQYFQKGNKKNNSCCPPPREHRTSPAQVAVPGGTRSRPPSRLDRVPRRAAGAAPSTSTRPGCGVRPPADTLLCRPPDTCGLALTDPYHRARTPDPPCIAPPIPRIAD
ncbi:unnamed protein product, partial [Brenthis ino]